ncbi:MAG: insulinase family protein [Gammaproteobacteria bacterium]|nr:insulinase family protein [Gammaproteobacteria bacterium]
MNIFLRMVTAMVGVLIAAPVIAQQTPPPGGPPRNFELPEFQRHTLDNGLQITLVPFGKIPKITIVVDVRTGNANEGEHTWLSDLAGELMKEGTEVRSAELINRQSARMGGQLFVSTGVDVTQIGMSVLSEFSEDAIGLVAEAIRQPAFPASELERLRANLLRQRSLALSQPSAIASAAYNKLLYGDHAYGRSYPSEEQLNSYTLAQVEQYYENNFGARRSHVMVAGQFDANKVLAAIKKDFSDWRSGPAVLINPPRPTDAARLKLIDRPGAPQANVIIGLTALAPSAPAYRTFSQMNTLLGGSFASRITANIREDKGYTYSPRSRVAGRISTSNWAQIAAVTTDVTGPAITEIFREIEKLRSTPPTVEEVENTQSYLTGTFVLQHATPRGLLGRLSYMALHNLPDSYLSEYLSHINAISALEINKVARKYLRPAKMTVVIVGDLEKIRPQLAAVPYLEGFEEL